MCCDDVVQKNLCTKFDAGFLVRVYVYNFKFVYKLIKQKFNLYTMLKWGALFLSSFFVSKIGCILIVKWTN